MKIETLAVHAGLPAQEDENEPLSQPITLGTTFERAADGDYKHGWSYTRAGNPNRNDWEAALAALEGGQAAAAFSSGSAATLAVFQALAPGDHVIATEGFYGTTKILREILLPWGLTCTLVNTSDLTAVQAAITGATKLLWIETPSNPRIRVSDIQALADIAHKAGARLVVDNTVASPVLQRCFDRGADLVMHSTTKYLGGHSDVLGGAIVARNEDEFFARIRTIQVAGGGVPSPFDCWLLRRGLRTLALRVRTQSENAMAIAEFLERQPGIEAVLYPGLPSYAGHDVAVRQMSAFGGLMAFQVKGGQNEALGLTARLKLIKRATSLGGTETTIDHRASVEPPGFGTPPNLLRLSVGIEHVDDLIADLQQAFRA
jgi:cystathionine gamma-synthase